MQFGMNFKNISTFEGVFLSVVFYLNDEDLGIYDFRFWIIFVLWTI